MDRVRQLRKIILALQFKDVKRRAMEGHRTHRRPESLVGAARASYDRRAAFRFVDIVRQDSVGRIWLGPMNKERQGVCRYQPVFQDMGSYFQWG